MRAGDEPLPDLTPAFMDALLDTAEHAALDSMTWGKAQFPDDTDAAYTAAMMLLVNATGHMAAQMAGATDDAARIQESADRAARQVGEAMPMHHALLMAARVRAQVTDTAGDGGAH